MLVSKIDLNNYNSPQKYRFRKNNINFEGGRVDKGLARFCKVNQDRMPMTAREYLNNPLNTKPFSPLDLQAKAYHALNYCKNIADVKKYFPNEELFDSLKDVFDVKSRTSMIKFLNKNKELIDLPDVNIFKNSEDNLTIYLLKQIFIKGHPLSVINNEMENDLDDDFKALYLGELDEHVKEEKYIQPQTLRVLGIKYPNQSYFNSLRYTNEEYVDSISQNISNAQIAFWNSLSPEQKLSRAKKSVENFENWWKKIPQETKLNMLIEQKSEIDLLELYNKEKPNLDGNNNITSETGTIESVSASISKPYKKTNVGSEILSQDEQFKQWAKSNLLKYEASLTDFEKAEISKKRIHNMIRRWSEMSPSEKTNLISKLKADSEHFRYIMIDTWNNSIDIIQDLSKFLILKQVEKPIDVIYSSKEFSEFQSKAMTEFWQNYPEHSKNLGIRMKNSRIKINQAIENGTFNELKKQIELEKIERVNEFKNLKINGANSLYTNDKHASSLNESILFANVYSKYINLDNHGLLPMSFKLDIKKSIDNGQYDDIKGYEKAFMYALTFEYVKVAGDKVYADDWELYIYPENLLQYIDSSYTEYNTDIINNVLNKMNLSRLNDTYIQLSKPANYSPQDLNNYPDSPFYFYKINDDVKEFVNKTCRDYKNVISILMDKNYSKEVREYIWGAMSDENQNMRKYCYYYHDDKIWQKLKQQIKNGASYSKFLSKLVLPKYVKSFNNLLNSMDISFIKNKIVYSIPPENSLDIAIIEQAIADYLYEHSNSSTDIYKNGIFDLLSIIQKNGIDKRMPIYVKSRCYEYENYIAELIKEVGNIEDITADKLTLELNQREDSPDIDTATKERLRNNYSL